MAQLDNVRVAVLATDGVEEVELTEPVKALREAGATVKVFAPKSGQIQAFNHDTPGDKLDTEGTVDQANPNDFDALLLPGGALNADAMRMEPGVQSFIKAIHDADKPMAVICHAPWEMVFAGIAKGHTMTSYHTIQDDVRNAGAQWVDKEVVVDGHLVTSRQPSDIPAFNREMITLFSRVPATSK
ncbi:MAG: protease [Chloroflexi bacterium]|nr:MAG: protease [Chloroflexota bacterium]